MEIINIRQFMNVIKYKVFLSALLLMLMSSCGLDLQTDYDYRPSVDDPHIQMTVWEYMSKNQDDFSIFQEAITYVGLEDYYRQSACKYTFLLLNNAAMRAYMGDVFPGVQSISECDSVIVKKMLLYHIVDGEYSSYGQLDVEPRYVRRGIDDHVSLEEPMADSCRESACQSDWQQREVAPAQCKDQ